MYMDILSNVVITKVRSASCVYTPENTRARKKDRPGWAAVLKYEGETVYTVGNRQFVSDKDTFVLLPKGCAYEWLCTQAGHFAIIEFESEQTAAEPVAIPVKNGEKLLKLFRELEYKRNRKLPLVEQESIRDIYTILLLALSNVREVYLPGDKQEKIAPAIDHISQNYHKSITNDELAALTGLSTVYFRKLFTQVTGMSPIAYVHDLRIRKAKEMLKSDYGSLSDVAESLGYASLYDFSRTFKKHTGVPPSRY